MIIPWRSVTQWVPQGENDSRNMCFFAMCGNHGVLLGKGAMEAGEVQQAAAEMAGFTPLDPSTDHGITMKAGFDYLKTQGWPGDSTLRLASWLPMALPYLGGVIARRGAAEAWVRLPTDGQGGYVFTDDALERDLPGVYDHAVLFVDPTTFITWEKPQSVSQAWLERYVVQVYECVWEDAA